MKQIIATFLIGICISLHSICQVPQTFKYQAIIRNSTNQVIINQPIAIRFSILKGSASGSSVYS